jgi:hypothetical protein
VDDLPAAFFAALAEFLAEDFAGLFFAEVPDEVALVLFTAVLAAVLFLGTAVAVCEPGLTAGFELDAPFVPEPDAV